MLGKTVRVPRHVELSEPGWRRAGPSLTSSFSPKLVQRFWKFVENGRYRVKKKPGTFTIDSLFGYYFGHHQNCNVFVANCIGILHFPLEEVLARSCCASRTTRSISSQGAGLPVQISNWRAAWWTNISIPGMTCAPRSLASFRKRVSGGSYTISKT